MNIQSTHIAGVDVVESHFHRDARGSFARLFCEQMLAELLNGRHIVQINHSHTVEAGSVRGMHFQRRPMAEMKLVRCLSGKVLDVAVDLRKGSPTRYQWVAQELSAGDGRMMVIPEGCAHGFQVLEPDSELLYLHTAAYSPEHEGGIRHDDPRVSVRWPMPVRSLSPRDQSFDFITDTFEGLDG